MIKNFFTACVLVVVAAAPAFLPMVSFAQSVQSAPTSDATALTITPPFFELNVSPGDSWSSAIRVVNTNATDLPVHAVLMGFGAQDEQGHGNFTPLSDLTDDSDALANWITIPNSSINVPRGGAADVPFSINVPQSASPGGHYAAILIGTQPAGGTPGASQVGVSSFISALIFVRVAGDVTESARIQQFSTDKSSYQTPDVHFLVQVQNTGNVHVRPVGMIQVYNAFGKKRAEIPINGTGNLGYVLPSSTREFDLEWQGQPSLLDIGPYTAVVSLAYGENGTKSASETIGFWILPIDQILEVLLGVLAAAAIVVFLLKRFVRRMLANEMTKYGGVPVHPPSHLPPHIPPAPPVEREVASSPDKEVLDLRNKNRK